uniref:Uncharacterized protein n=1 Tax=Tetradesmus obliquus TaxID=3088 RepID=A0A383V7V9_TETOB|eukprot:jgi/Sobl393_1/15326/SZX60426.1
MPVVVLLALASFSQALPAEFQQQQAAEKKLSINVDGLDPLATLQSFRENLAHGKEALLAPKSPLSIVKAATPEQQQAAAPKPQQQQSLLSSLASSARKLLSQGTWVGTDAPSFNGASMGWYQGYPNRFRAGNAASSMWAAQNGDPNNFGAGYNPYIGGRKLMSQQAVQGQQSSGTWVGTDAPSFNAASMGYYQGYPNRFRAGNAASSMWAAQNGDPNNFGAGYNPYIGGRKLMSQQAVQGQQSSGAWVGTDAPSFNAASMGYYQGYPNRFRAGNAASSMWAAQNGDPNNFGAGYNPYIGGRKLMSQQAVQGQQSSGTWVGTDAPSFNAASMGYYQGYPNRFRAGNAASSMWAAQNGDPNNFGAGYNPYIGGRRMQ